MTKKKKPGKKPTQKRGKAGAKKGEAIDLSQLDLTEPDWAKLGVQDISSLDFADMDELISGVTLEDMLGLPPQEKVGTEGKRRGSVKDVAEWMLAELEKTRTLYQSQAARSILQRFGGGFIYRNRHNNYALDVEVLEHFRTLTEKTVVWVRRGRFWRWREEGDPPGREV
jgi:hypothetical protein